jgi:transposase-like protein
VGGSKKSQMEVVALALAMGKPVATAAREGGVGERSIYRWLEHNDSFRDRIAALRSDLVDRAVGLGSAFLARAIGTLAELLTSKRESIRLSAARALVSASLDLRSASDTQFQISELQIKLEELRKTIPSRGLKCS